jgi:hypothetical protein
MIVGFNISAVFCQLLQSCCRVQWTYSWDIIIHYGEVTGGSHEDGKWETKMGRDTSAGFEPNKDMPGREEGYGKYQTSVHPNMLQPPAHAALPHWALKS